jgi:tetratricopeptide (TPR) repeat protein
MFQDKRFRFTLWFSLGMTFLLVVVLGMVGEDQRGAVVIGLGIITILGQCVLLFGRTSLHSPVATAQTAFIAGDYAQAQTLLKSFLKDHPDHTKALTLLGNTCRQLGTLSTSENHLRHAVELDPENPFPLYGLGRTLLAKGDFVQAAKFIRLALEKPSSRKAIRTELALALHCANADSTEIVRVCRQAMRVLRIEAYRVLMVNFLLYNKIHDNHADLNEIEFTKRVIKKNAHGLAFWKAEAKRHADTPFGVRLHEDINAIEALLDHE